MEVCLYTARKRGQFILMNFMVKAVSGPKSEYTLLRAVIQNFMFFFLISIAMQITNDLDRKNERNVIVVFDVSHICITPTAKKKETFAQWHILQS